MDSWTTLSKIAEVFLKQVFDHANIERVFSPWTEEEINKPLSSSNKRCIELAIKYQNEVALRYLFKKKVNTNVELTGRKSPLELAKEVSESIHKLLKGLMSKQNTTPQTKSKVKSPATEDRGSKSPAAIGKGKSSAPQGKGPAEDKKKVKKDWSDEVNDLMERYKDQARKHMSSQQEQALLQSAKDLAKDAPSSDESGELDDPAWKWPIRMFRNREALLGLMMLTRMSKEPSEADIKDSITNSNEAALYYLAAIMREYPRVQQSSYHLLDYLPNAKAFLKKDDDSEGLKLPKELVETWKELAALQRHEPEKRQLEQLDIMHNKIYPIGIEWDRYEEGGNEENEGVGEEDEGNKRNEGSQENHHGSGEESDFPLQDSDAEAE